MIFVNAPLQQYKRYIYISAEMHFVLQTPQRYNKIKVDPLAPALPITM